MDGEEVLAGADVQCVGQAAETLAEGEVVDGLQEVGLPHPVVAHQTVDVGAELHIEVGVGLEVGEFERGYMHGESVSV